MKKRRRCTTSSRKKLEEMTENADQMAEYLKWKVEDLLLSGKTADQMRIKDAGPVALIVE